MPPLLPAPLLLEQDRGVHLHGLNAMSEVALVQRPKCWLTLTMGKEAIDNQQDQEVNSYVSPGSGRG